MSSTPERPLDQVLSGNIADFVPEKPTKPPWHQPSGMCFELAVTDNRAVVNLKVAGRVQLRNLGDPSYEDWLEPVDRMAGPGWGVAPA
jgi:hypothetical protein